MFFLELLMKKLQFTKEIVTNLANEAYLHGTADFDVDPSDCVLLVIDLQNEFVKPGWSPYWVPEATNLIPKINKLIDQAREFLIPIIFTLFSDTHHYFDRPFSGKYMANRFNNLKIDQSEYFFKSQLYKDLHFQDHDIIISKPSYGAFYDTPLETILKNFQRKTVIITGTLTNYCCGTTARQAYERGFKVVFGSDLTATDDPDMQEPELKVLRKGFAKVMSSSEIIQAISK